MLLLLAGQVGPWTGLQDARREVHEAIRAERAAAIAERTARRTPLDDSTDWRALGATADDLVACVQRHETASVRAIAVDVLAATSGAIVPLEAYEHDPELEGIRVRCRVLSEARRRVLAAELDMAITGAAQRGADVLAALEADEAGIAAIAVYVGESLAGLEGVYACGDGDGTVTPVSLPLDGAAIDGLRRTGLLTILFVACRAFQGLSAKKALRFGQPVPSTSRSDSIVADARSAGGNSSGATAALSNDTSRAPPTRQTDAHAGTLRTTGQTSSEPFPYDVPQASTSGSTASTS